MKLNLHQKSLKLALLYLSIIMVISLFFSINIYQLSTSELARGLRGPGRPAGPGFSYEIREEIYKERQEIIKEAKERVLARLMLINLLIFIGGGALSYFLALRTLKPIEEAQESQSRFTADASHELRTPITAMLAENEVALMDPKLNLGTAKSQLASNIEELYKLITLSDGLMRLAGLDNAELIKDKINLKDVVDRAVISTQLLADTKNIYVNFKAQDKIVNVIGDSNSLQECIKILLDNAIKYSPKNTAIELVLRSTQTKAIISIKDNGMGIKASDLPHIFDRFYRADQSRTKQKVDGYGIGLSIAKNIVEKHGGTIVVKSIASKGSTFTISLPLKPKTS